MTIAPLTPAIRSTSTLLLTERDGVLALAQQNFDYRQTVPKSNVGDSITRLKSRSGMKEAAATVSFALGLNE
jgi:hypothetical protein